MDGWMDGWWMRMDDGRQKGWREGRANTEKYYIFYSMIPHVLALVIPQSHKMLLLSSVY